MPARSVGLALVALGLAAVPAAADRASLYRGPAPRPGPSVLYARATTPPQLTNTAPWRARPILVSGAESYRSGEFVYQDFLFDDHGARGTGRDPRDPRAGGDLFAPPNGTYTYPTSSAYAGNAADLVEVRIRPTGKATLFRLTFNTMKDPSRMAATLALGTATAARPVPFGANATARARVFVTWHGDTISVVRVDGRFLPRRVSLDIHVDRRRHQVTLGVPHTVWNPGRTVARVSAGAGLWDRGAGRYLIPRAGAADATDPGGAAGIARPTAFFNLAFRRSEPLPKRDLSALSDPTWWRDRDQARALATGDLSAFHADVDFAKLARGARDDRGVPRTGPLNRILPSRFADGQGTDYATTCGLTARRCIGQLHGRLQPYSLYVPPRRPAGGRYALTLLLHSLTANYNEFSGSRNQRRFADRDGGSLVLTSEARGPDGFYVDRAAADTFEVWADVARRYRLRPAATTIAGYSMGGFGTFRLAEQFPDLFARAQPTAGFSTSGDLLASLRNVPVRMWNAVKDEIVPYAAVRGNAQRLDRLGYRYELDSFLPALVLPPTPAPNHLTLAVQDQFGPVARFLDSARVVRDPVRVTYAYHRRFDAARSGIRAGHAYWVSGVRLRRADRVGQVDVRSLGFGRGDPPVSALRRGSGRLGGGLLGTLTFAVEKRTWGAAPRRPKRNRLRIVARNVAAVTIDPRRGRVTCGARVSVRSDGPLKVRLAGCPAR
jgi:acyl dehydratase/predicted esterase